MAWKIFRGDTITRQLTFQNEDGTPMDISGATVYFTAKTATDDDITDSNAIKKDITVHDNAAGGLSTLLLTPAETNVSPAKYTYEFQLKTAAGAITTYPGGKLEVLADVTRRTS